MQGKLKFSKGRAQRPRGQGWLLAEIPLAAAEVRKQMPLLLVLEPAFWKGSLGMAGEAGEKKQQVTEVEIFPEMRGLPHHSVIRAADPTSPHSGRIWPYLGAGQHHVSDGISLEPRLHNAVTSSVQCLSVWQLVSCWDVVSKSPRMTLTTSLFKQLSLELSWLTGGGIINGRTRSSSGKCGFLLQWPFAWDLLLYFFLLKTTGWRCYIISMK